MLIIAEINMFPLSHASMSGRDKKKHHQQRGEEAHLHFRARFGNLCRPLLICPSLPRPSALNANKPKAAGVQRPRIRIHKQFKKRHKQKATRANSINISQLLITSSSGNKRRFRPTRFANWAWLFVKKMVPIPPPPPLREKTSPLRLLTFHVVCTNKICLFDKPSA